MIPVSITLRSKGHWAYSMCLSNQTTSRNVYGDGPKRKCFKKIFLLAPINNSINTLGWKLPCLSLGIRRFLITGATRSLLGTHTSRIPCPGTCFVESEHHSPCTHHLILKKLMLEPPLTLFIIPGPS